MGYFDKLRENLAKLDLSDEQKAKIKSLKDDLEAKGQVVPASGHSERQPGCA